MWINYLKIAIRNLIKDSRYSLINVVGLSLGLATTLLIVLFVKSEWTYDHFHSKKDQIHRVWVKEFVEGDVFFNTTTPIVVGEALVDNFPEATKLTRYMQVNMMLRIVRSCRRISSPGRT